MSLEILNGQLRGNPTSYHSVLSKFAETVIPTPSKPPHDFSLLYLHFKENLTDLNRLVSLFEALTILLRDPSLRESFPLEFVEPIPALLNSSRDRKTSPKFKVVCGNVLTNICHSEKHTLFLLEETTIIASLFGVLGNHEETFEVKSSACGVIHGLSAHLEGKQRILIFPDCLKLMSQFLFRGDSTTSLATMVTMKERILGTFNNLTSDFEVALHVRDLKLVPILVKCLKSKRRKIFGPAIGCLQNISRDLKSRKEIIRYGGIEGVSNILFSEDVEAQKCAAVVLLNLSRSMDTNDPRRVALKKILSLSILMGQMMDVFFSEKEMKGEEGKQKK